MVNDTVLLRCESCNAVNKVFVDKLTNRPKCGKCKAYLEFPKTPVETSTADFEQEVFMWPGLVMLDFWAQWCGACRMIEPVLKELAYQKAGYLKIVKIDVDKEPHIAKRYGIQATPPLILYQKDKKLNEITGALSKQELEEWIDSSSKS